MAGLLKQPRGGPAQAPQPAPAQAPQEPDENDPAFQAAMKFAMQALYVEGAADDVSEALKKSPDITEALSSTAYEMTSIVDEKTQGGVPDELLVLLAARILEEVTDIAIASGIEVTPKVVSEAFKIMILRYVGEQGHDTRQLQEAMDSVSDEDFDALLTQAEQPTNEVQ